MYRRWAGRNHRQIGLNSTFSPPKVNVKVKLRGDRPEPGLYNSAHSCYFFYSAPELTWVIFRP